MADFEFNDKEAAGPSPWEAKHTSDEGKHHAPRAHHAPSAASEPAPHYSVTEAEMASTPRAPSALAHDAVLEQMAHSMGYAGGKGAHKGLWDGESKFDRTDQPQVATHNDGIDSREMLRHNGYRADPKLINGANGLQMVVYLPAPKMTDDIRPVVAFRGTSEWSDVATDFNPDGVGADQYEANAALIEQTMQSAARHGQVEVTGHSLGGGLAQTVAARNPDQVAHITTFQGAGMSDEDANELREVNRDRASRGLDPIAADHYRAEGDIVPVGSGRHADGVVHMTRQETSWSSEIPIFGGNSAASHTNYLATPMAQRTAEGRAALPWIPQRDETTYETATLSTNDEAAQGSRILEYGRRGVGLAGQRYGAPGSGPIGTAFDSVPKQVSPVADLYNHDS